MYKYRVSLWNGEEKAKKGWEGQTTENPVEFFTPLHIGEKVILSSHVRQLWSMPHWTQEQEIWVVKEIFHQISEAIEEADIAIFFPTSQGLEDIV